MHPRGFIPILTALVVLCLSATSSLASPPQNSAEVYNRQGLSLLADEKFEEAAKAFQAAIKLKRDYAEAYYHLGDAFCELGEVKKAIDAYKQAIHYQPDFALAYNGLGTAYGTSEYNKSIEAYQQSIRLDPKAPLTHYNLGVAYSHREKKESAAAEYKILKDLDPSLAQDLYNIIYQPITPVAADGTVRLNVIALDSHAVPIDSLSAAQFRILEDNAPQEISSVQQITSAFYCISVDTSGSVRPIINSVLKTAQQIVDAMPAQDQALLVRFISSDKIENIQEFTNSKRRLDDALDSLFVEDGQSAVLDAVYLSAQKLASYKFPERKVRRVLILLTDGDDRASYYSLPQVLELLRKMDVQIFAISFGTDKDGTLNQSIPKKSVDLLRTLTSETGGATFFPKSEGEMKAAVSVMLSFVGREYTIEYKPTKVLEAGNDRSVSVTLVPDSQRQNPIVMSRSRYVVAPKQVQ